MTSHSQLRRQRAGGQKEGLLNFEIRLLLVLILLILSIANLAQFARQAAGLLEFIEGFKIDHDRMLFGANKVDITVRSTIKNSTAVHTPDVKQGIRDPA